MPTRCNRLFYCRSYCLLNMFRAPLCPSSGAREYYTGGCCLWYLVPWFSSCRYGVQLKVMCPVCGLLLQQQPGVCSLYADVSKHSVPRMKMEQSVPKRRHIKFRRQGITQKKEYYRWDRQSVPKRRDIKSRRRESPKRNNTIDGIDRVFRNVGT